MTKSPQIGENPSGLEVLIVDDERLIRWSLRRGLAGRDHIVTEAGDAEQALQALSLAPERFDAVILDYRLPDRQDLTLLADIRRLAPRAAVWIMTAFGDTSMRREALALGARAVVDKPFQVDTFIDLVEAGCSDRNPHG